MANLAKSLELTKINLDQFLIFRQNLRLRVNFAKISKN